MPRSIPRDAVARAPTTPFDVDARRALPLLGAEVELVWVPSRAARSSVPGMPRPPFTAGHAEHVLRDEASWRGQGCVLTPNRFPLAAGELLLWQEEAEREPGRTLLELAFDFEAGHGGAALFNAIGAAASIPRVHAHLVPERSAWLDALPAAPLAAPWLDPLRGVETLRLAPPFPALAVGVRGTPRARAAAVLDLLRRRTTAPWNVVAQGGTAWVFPRRVEVPSPGFPHALGAAELWGRWFYTDHDAFEAADPEGLLRALETAGVPVRSG